MTLEDADTPCLILDTGIMRRNIARMAARCTELGVNLRPHFKTPKSLPAAEALVAAGAIGLCVSTVREAEYLAEGGFSDLFIAVPVDSRKVARLARLVRKGTRLSVLADTLQSVRLLADMAQVEAITLPVWIEIDVDHYRTGVDPESPDFEAMIASLHDAPHLELAGIMSYGGASYGCKDPAAAADLAERHRLALVAAADKVAGWGFARPTLSFGSTPAVLHARHLDGVDEVRCGIYLFQDLFQAGIGAAGISDIAVSVLATVTAHAPALNRFTVDAGALALSKDRSTQGHPFDAGFGLVCDLDGQLIPDLHVSTVSQELGLVTSRSGAALDLARYPIGSRIRILPNHADMTAAAYELYHLVEDGLPHGTWERCNGW